MPGGRPSSVLVVDANIVVSAALGSRSGRALVKVGEVRELATSERVAHEARSIARHIAPHREDAVELVDACLELMEIVPVPDPAAEEAAEILRNAVASRNGSVADAPLLALAWALDADLWSHDRDFAGTGWPSWSSANLLACLGDRVAAG